MVWVDTYSVRDSRGSFTLTMNSGEAHCAGYVTKESISGRKCFEFKWIDGNKGFCFGFISNSDLIFFYGIKGNPVVILRYHGKPDIKANIPEFIQNDPYLACIDTKERRFDLIHKTTHLSYNYSSEYPRKMQAFINEGACGTYIDKVSWKFRNFETRLPSAFFSLSDWRNTDIVTCARKRNSGCTVYFNILLTVTY